MHTFVRELSDERLLQTAEAIGTEIDRRWTGRYSVLIKDSMDVYIRYQYRLWCAAQEQLYALLLDHRHRVIAERLISMGTINASLVHAREVFAPAIEKRASAIVLIHNHPTGLADPSDDDIKVTKRLKKAGDLIGIRLLDHIIIGKNQYYSILQNRMIEVES